MVEVLGPGATGFRKGSRVAFGPGGFPGCYTEFSVQAVANLVKLPAYVDNKTAAAALSKGWRVEYLFNRMHKLKAGETILFQAAAGGVGPIACQWANAVGATLIGRVSKETKAKLAKKYGVKHVIVTSKQNITDEVMRLIKGEGVDVVCDSIGKTY